MSNSSREAEYARVLGLSAEKFRAAGSKTTMVDTLAAKFGEASHAIPQTPLLGRLMPKMKRLAAEYIIQNKKKSHPEGSFDVEPDQLDKVVSDADALYYAAVLCVAPAVTEEDHLSEGPARDEWWRQSKDHGFISLERLIDEQRTMDAYRHMTLREHIEIANRRIRFLKLGMLILEMADWPDCVFREKLSLVAALLLPAYDEPELRKEAEKEDPEFAQLLNQLREAVDFQYE